MPQYKHAALVLNGVLNFAVSKISWSHYMHIVLNNYGLCVNTLGFTSLARLRYHIFLSEAVIGSRQKLVTEEK